MERGIRGTFPATIITAIVSPKALENPSITAATIPNLARRITTRLVVCQRVAPRVNDASRKPCGTALITSSVKAIIIGKTITAKTRLPANKLNPVGLLFWKSGRKPNHWSITGPRKFLMKGTMMSIPHTPKITDGIPARISINDLITDRIRCGEYSAR